ncbi:MAG TPA: hypothetical protein VFX59_10500 [Polyangiales bacterium]|nr:hypothetical protein [Polyangiales bacterium]
MKQRLLTSLPQLLAFAVLAAALALAERAPMHFERLMQEDGPAEWATFLAFACAGGIGLGALRSTGGYARLTLLAVCAFCLFVAGEEISWGQRIVGFRPPALFLEHNYQQESNLHNLLKGMLDTRWMVLTVALLYGVIAPYVVYLTRWSAVWAAPLPCLPWFAAVAWLEFAYPYELVGELAELALGLAFLWDVIVRTEGRPERVALAQAVALAGAFLLSPLYDVALSLHSEDLVAHTREELDALAMRMRDGDALRDGLFRKRDVHKRLYTAVKAGYLALEPGEFYLDAWNSPYWFSFERTGEAQGKVVLYSLGPNRKRDLAPDTTSASGDDVRLAFEVDAPARADAR